MSGLFSLRIIIFLRFISITACIRTSNVFKAELHSIIWMYDILFVHSSDSGPLGFHFLAPVNNAPVNMSVQMPVHVPAFSSLEYIPRSGIPASW